MATTTEEERAQAGKMRHGGQVVSGTVATILDEIQACELDENALQKYVLIRAEAGKAEKWLVRGNRRAAYHMDAASATVEHLRGLDGVKFEVVGGGRIRHEGATILIYGHSYGFPWQGRFRHDLSAKVVGARYPDAKVSTSDEGY